MQLGLDVEFPGVIIVLIEPGEGWSGWGVGHASRHACDVWGASWDDWEAKGRLGRLLLKLVLEAEALALSESNTVRARGLC